MKVLVCAHHLELGGTQTNAIDLAHTVSERAGHDVVLFAAPGPAAGLVVGKRFTFAPAPTTTRYPSLTKVRALRRLIDVHRPDVIHVWDWPQCLDAFYGSYLDRRVPILCSSMSMTVANFLPRSVPTTFGTPALHAEALRTRPDNVFLLEPPVDLEANRPGVVDGDEFRAQHRVGSDELLVVVVSRLTSWMKLEGLQNLIDAVGAACDVARLRLVIVGEGPGEATLRLQAVDLNERAGRTVVTLAGPLLDPRPAYEAADIVAGMGSSALRAMAFAKPVIVLGENAFSEIFDDLTAPGFVWNGIYGLGDGDGRLGRLRLTDQVRDLARSEARRQEVAEVAFRTVTERYGLGTAADHLDRLYRSVAQRLPSRPRVAVDTARTAAIHWGPRMLPAPVKTAVRQARGAQRS